MQVEVEIDDVIKTYKVLVSHLKKLPGTRLEDMFKKSDLPMLEAELRLVEGLKYSWDCSLGVQKK